jgi:predicted CoA-binding protein
MTIAEILSTYKVIAVVGLSDNPRRPSHSVTKYMLDCGYDIIPVNPMHERVFGRLCYPNLSSLPDELKSSVQIVNIFRKSEDVPPVVEEAIRIGAKVVWMQLGIVNDAAAGRAREAGLEAIQNRCIMVEHQRYFS